MNSVELLDKLRDLYLREQSDEMINLTDIAMALQSEQPIDEQEAKTLGECCRYIYLAFYRKQRYQDGDKWWHLSLQNYEKGKYIGGLATIMLMPAYGLMAEKNFEFASFVMRLMEAFVSISSSLGEEQLEDISRIARENIAYCKFRGGDSCAAIPIYAEARALATDERARAKVEGGAILARLLCPDDPLTVSGAIDELRQVKHRISRPDLAQDVVTAIDANVAYLEGGDEPSVDTLTHFQIV